MICASITGKTVESMVRTAKETKADVFELRLDYLKETDGLERLSRIKKPVIATCMPVWEGGLYKGSEKKRISLLEECTGFADYVTVELKTNPVLRRRLVKSARARNAKVIVAYHDYKKTPSTGDIIKTIRREHGIGDIAKVAFKPKGIGDVLRLMGILAEKRKAKKPVIALSMGKAGRISRIVGPLAGSYLTYASASIGREAGPGQLSVDELKCIFSILERR
jgi:3-dehydroquinate dehydratase-1